jgi:hypothetical protein
MATNSPIEDRPPLRIPPIVWFLGVILITALAAIFVFNVAVSTVLNYGFFVLMMGSHLFMHGSHGGHQHGSPPNVAESNTNEKPERTGGCH